MVLSKAKKSSKKEEPLLYTIESFRIRSHEVEHFDMMALRVDLPEIHPAQKPHRHDCFIILVISTGTGFHTVDSEVFKLEPNSIFLLSPGQIHSINSLKELSGYAVYFTPEFYLHYARERHFDSIPFFRSLEAQLYTKTTPAKMRGLTVILEEMFFEYTEKVKAKDEVLRNLLDVLLLRLNRLWRHDQLIAGNLTNSIQMRKLMDLIEKHFKSGKTAGDYAKLLHLTLNHLNSLCRKSVNRTVTDLIQNRILLEAKRLLAYTDYPVRKIASELGFRDTNYFQRLFKKKTKKTPDAFRNIHSTTIQG